MQRLGRNDKGYRGETIDIGEILGGIARAARLCGWERDVFCEAGGFPLLALTRPARRPANPVLRFYLSSGIHGDEPAGPLAMLRLIEENRWPEEVELRLCPCLNPAGFALNRRENAGGIDLNRDYLQPASGEVRAHIAWLERQPRFDLCLLLHEDWEAHGFYLYEQNPDNQPSLAEPVIDRVSALCPIDRSDVIEGRPAQGGIVRPRIDPRTLPQWPEAFYLIAGRTRLLYTLEAPSDFPLSARVTALVTAVNVAVESRVGRRG